MSIESSIGRATNEVTSAISDSICSSLVPVLKNEMNLSNDQVTKILSLVRLNAEHTGMNAVKQYVSLFKDLNPSQSKK